MGETNNIPMIDSNFCLTTFVKNWKHCDQTSNYLAQLVNFSKNQYHTRLVSTILNEILEVIFHYSEVKGRLTIKITHRDANIKIECKIPVNQQSQQFYQQTFDKITRATNDSVLYFRELERGFDGYLDPAIGLYEVMADYGVKISYDYFAQTQEVSLTIFLDNE